MNHYKNILFITFIILFSNNVRLLADSIPSIKVIARPFKTSIMLRWAPTTPVAWKYLNKFGYRIDRYSILMDSILVNKPVRKILTPVPLKPWEPERWKKMMDTSDIAAVVAQAIFGETFEISENTNVIAKMINKSKELESRFSFALFETNQSTKVAEAAGLYYNDTSALSNEHYLYRIISLVPDSLERIDSGFIYTGIADYTPLPRPILYEVKFTGKSALIQWDKMHFENIFNNYIIERSDDSCHTFKRINDVPFVNVYDNNHNDIRYYSKLDSVPLTGKIYSYRIKGISVFGEVSPPSDTISEICLPEVKFRPSISNAEIILKNMVRIKWDFPKEGIPDIKGFRVFRSNKADKDFEIITKELLHSDIDEFTDTKPALVNYYKVKVIGKNDKEAESFPYLVQLEDSIPPEAPRGLSGNIDSTGIVTLHWNANKEDDMKGYLVFRANFATDEFTQITSGPVSKPAYRDSINIKTLTRKIFYRVKAIDRRYNQSKYSEILELTKPDIIPPQPPVFINFKADTGGIHLYWEKSNSVDVSGILLYRRQEGDRKWQLIAQFNEPDTTKTFYDKPGNKSLSYEYTIIAVDSSKLESVPAKPLRLKTINNGIRPAITSVFGIVKAEFKTVELSWNYKEEDVVSYVIYKGEAGKPLATFRTVAGNENKFSDRQVEVHKTYVYKIKAVFADGTESALSAKVVVEF